jgi:hypothetical protein
MHNPLRSEADAFRWAVATGLGVHGVVRRAREEIDLPVTHVVVDLEAERAGA